MRSKLHTLIVLLITYLYTPFAIAQNEIPNPGFENWSGGNPVGWDTSNENILGTNFVTVTQQTSNPHAGNACARITTVTNNIFLVGPVTMPGMVTLGELFIDFLNQTASITGGVPVSGLPKFLKGFYKYTPSNVDSAFIGIGLTRWNGTSADTVGYAYKSFGGVITNWQEFSVPIEYFSPDWPDTMNIVLISSNNVPTAQNNGSTLQVDDLMLEYSGVAVQDIGLDKQCFVYEGSDNQLYIKTPGHMPSDIAIFSLNGTQTARLNNCNSDTNQIPVSNLQAGVYFAKITLPGNIVKTVKFIKL